MIYRMSEWQSGTGVWYCNCIDKLAEDSGHWLHPVRILELSPAAYVQWVIKNYNPQVWHNKDCSLIFFSWENQSDMRKYKNYINKVAREKQYQI